MNAPTQTQRAINRIADRIDLAIDFFTLGQYGLEQVPAPRAGCEGSGPRADWEALQPARTRGSRCSARCRSAALTRS